MAGHVRINSDRLIFETIDDETVIIDTVAGRLTLLIGIGPSIWERLAAGESASSILEALSARYGATAADEGSAFISSLTEAGLLVESADALDTAQAPGGGTADWPHEYASPGLEQHDDIADIMTMDPIHEVDNSRGWPRVDPHDRG